MKKIYHLATCDTNRRILSELKPGPEVVLQEIKTEPLQADQLEELKLRAGSYAALFSKTARKYRLLGLHERELSESDYKALILEEYTFLKRPVVVCGDRIFIGNSAAVVREAAAALK
jgi:arsenate reductase